MSHNFAVPAVQLVLLSLVAGCATTTASPPSTGLEAGAARPPAAAPVGPETAPPAAPSPPPPQPSATLAKGAVEVEVRLHHEIADGSHPTELQTTRLVGHYTTPNGKIGFILDRTSDPPRIRLDGDRYTLVMTPRPASKGWLDYVAGNLWVRLDETTGSILGFEGPNMREPSYVVRDADARPLDLPR